MLTKTDGGPAFPQYARVGEVEQAIDGMSLRDYFAAKALAGFMSAFADFMMADKDAGRVAKGIENTTHLSYAIADAMLAERDKQ